MNLWDVDRIRENKLLITLFRTINLFYNKNKLKTVFLNSDKFIISELINIL